MFNSLRKKLTVLCVIITGIILSATAVGLLFLSENQMDRQSEITFQNNLNSVIYKIQSSNTLDNLWLAQLEAGNRLIVHIEDNGRPVLFRGSWTPTSSRDELIASAQKKAMEDYGFDVSVKPYSVIDVDSVSFELKGDQGDHYQAAAALIPTVNGNWRSITLLRDISADRNEKLVMRLAFLGLIAAALLLLFLFSWWFAGRSIEPIERSQKKQTEFVAAASHELRSPLAVIQASLPVLREDGMNTAEIAEAEAAGLRTRFADAIDRECRRMARLIDDLLFLASADAQAWTIQSERIEPDTLMIELFESFNLIAGKKQVSLSLDLPENALPPVFGDKGRLFQALSILVDNGLSYTSEGGHITLCAQLQRHRLLLSVSDDGIGVPDDEKDRIFERFYRTDPSRSKKEHYGLGLSIAKEIAELHGGTLAVSDTPGGGASFTMRLPLHSQ